MDTKQFTRLQEAVQHAYDDDKLERYYLKHPELERPEKKGWLRWMQASWGSGTVTKEKVDSTTELSRHVVCPSTGCVAGTIVVMYGDKMITDDEEPEVGDEVTADNCMDIFGEVHDIEFRACELIGIEEDETALFNGGLNIANVVDIATTLAASYGHELVIKH